MLCNQFMSHAVLVEYDFQSLLKKICSLDRKLGEALGRYHAALSTIAIAPNYVVESYPFGFPMFVEGKPPTSKLSQELSPSRFGTSAFPLGFIINGYVEVTDYVFGAGAPRRAPQAVLKPGDFVGIFEFTDWITRGKLGSIPDWTITAGAASIFCAFNTSNDAFARHLRRRFGPQAINEHAIKNSTSFFGQLMDVQDVKDIFSRWTTDVVYLATDWFRPLFDDEVDAQIRSTGLELTRILGERAWRAAARVRPASSGIAPFFFGGRTNEHAKFTRPELHERQRAIHVFTSLYDLHAGRRPMFVPEQRDGPWGPIGEICAAVLKGYKSDEEPFILRPEYLTDAFPNAVAYMPIENIASDLVESGGAHERAFMNALNVIDAAARLDEQTDGRSILSEFGNMIEALSVRLPAGKEAGGARSASVATCDVLRNPSKGVKFLPMEEGSFFEPYDIKLDNPGAEFFKTCIRFSHPR